MEAAPGEKDPPLGGGSGGWSPDGSHESTTVPE